VVEDQTTFRELVAELLAGQWAYDVVGAASAAEALAAIERRRHDLVVLDLVLPDGHGLDVLDALRTAWPRTPVVVLTAQSRPTVVRRLVELGVQGIVTKGAPLRELREALDHVAHGGMYRCSETQRLRQADPADAGGAELTARQLQILREVASGKTSKEIAAALGLSTKTVINHRARIMDRLGVRDVAGLTRYAIAHGLVDAAY
jgi:DNA-binding NarL/FixJ family response regulator